MEFWGITDTKSSQTRQPCRYRNLGENFEHDRSPAYIGSRQTTAIQQQGDAREGEGKGNAVSASTNSQADAAHELGIVQIVDPRPGGGGGDLLLLHRLRRVAVGGHPPSLPPRFVWPPQGTGGRNLLRLREREEGHGTPEAPGGGGGGHGDFGNGSSPAHRVEAVG
jgi:hypothetical protein